MLVCACLQDGWTPLHLASWNGHYDVVRELISAKCQLNIKNEVSGSHDPFVVIAYNEPLVNEAIQQNNVTENTGGIKH